MVHYIWKIGSKEFSCGSHKEGTVTTDGDKVNCPVCLQKVEGEKKVQAAIQAILDLEIP